jgi:ribosomal protein S18 acetylase RimI-like enzyme
MGSAADKLGRLAGVFRVFAAPTPSHIEQTWCAADKAMQDVFGAKYVSLHVRVTNQGAHHLYTQSLGYECARLSLELLLSCSCGAAQLDARDLIT